MVGGDANHGSKKWFARTHTADKKMVDGDANHGSLNCKDAYRGQKNGWRGRKPWINLLFSQYAAPQAQHLIFQSKRSTS